MPNQNPSSQGAIGSISRPSPTDVSNHHIYPYQNPERDEQGTFFGYKVLKRHCSNPSCDKFVSPMYEVLWEDGQLNADKVPAAHHMHGIHFTKRPDHPELEKYNYKHFNPWGSYSRTCLVRCALYGTVVETEQGFRAEKAMIVEVYDDGNWKNYQDYKGRTPTNSRDNSQEVTWEAWEYRGKWYVDTSNTSPTST